MTKLKSMIALSLIALSCLIYESTLASSPTDSTYDSEEENSGRSGRLTTGNWDIAIIHPQKDVMFGGEPLHSLFGPAAEIQAPLNSEELEGLVALFSSSDQEKDITLHALAFLEASRRIRLPGSRWR